MADGIAVGSTAAVAIGFLLVNEECPGGLQAGRVELVWVLGGRGDLEPVGEGGSGCGEVLP